MQQQELQELTNYYVSGQQGILILFAIKSNNKHIHTFFLKGMNWTNIF